MSTHRDPSPPRSMEPDSLSPSSLGSPRTTDSTDSADWWTSHPEHPRNWRTSRKWRSTMIMSLYTLVSPLASTMIAPAIPGIAVNFHITNSVVMTLVLSIFLLAFAFGPLILSPMSELWGRIWVLHACNIIYLVFNVACALAPSTGALLAFRFLAGLGGSAPMNIGGGLITDLFDANTRTAPIAVYTLMTLLSPVAGPIAGGFIAQSAGFKWIFWAIAIAAGVVGIVAFIGLEETFAEIVQKRVAQKEGRKLPDGDGTGIGVATVREEGFATNEDERSLEKSKPIDAKELEAGRQQQLLQTSRQTKRDHLVTSFSRPIALLFGNLTCFVLSVFSAIVYGYLYILFATFPVLFAEIYHWKVGIAGLAYIGPGIGSIIATGLVGVLVDKTYKHLAKREPDGVGKPEFRLPPMIFGSLLVPAGLLWYGWSADKALHWIHPLLGSGMFATGAFLIIMTLSIYLVDTFYYAASALAAASVLRSLFGFAFPLFGEDMFAALGLGPSYSLLAGISIVIGLPFPVWLFYYGEKLRKKGNNYR